MACKSRRYGFGSDKLLHFVLAIWKHFGCFQCVLCDLSCLSFSRKSNFEPLNGHFWRRRLSYIKKHLQMFFNPFPKNNIFP